MTAHLPTGFDFTGCGAGIIGHEVIATSVENVRVRAPIRTVNQRAVIRVTNLKLGLVGGPTLFDLVTKLNDGTRLDERVGYTGGFRLPGRLAVLDKKMNSMYQQDPEAYPVPALLGSRTSEPARATFTFTVTRQANINTRLFIEASPYEFKTDYFSLNEVATGIVVPTVIRPPTGKHIDVGLLGPLWANTQFRVEVS